MNIEVTANKIASNYLANNADMNDSIAKYAMENNLNIEQTKRLVEESNKNCYLQKFASTGEQIFDVAQFNIVKEKIGLIDKVEKTAAIKFNEIGEFEKVAEENIDTLEYDGAIAKCRQEIGATLSKVASLHKSLVYKNRSLEKLAYSEIDELKPYMEQIERKEKVIDWLIEKKAFIGKAIGSTISGAGKLIVNHPNKVMMGGMGVQAVVSNAKKAKPESETHMMNQPLNKEAGIISEAIPKFLQENAGPAAILATIGLGIGAAKAGGGLISKMMEERQLNESFNTIQKANADIRQIPNARAYFDVVARHSPSLALDPMVAPQLIRNFDTFGGVDINTVGKLREIEDTGKRSNSSGSFDQTSSLVKTLNTLKSRPQQR